MARGKRLIIFDKGFEKMPVEANPWRPYDGQQFRYPYLVSSSWSYLRRLEGSRVFFGHAVSRGYYLVLCLTAAAVVFSLLFVIFGDKPTLAGHFSQFFLAATLVTACRNSVFKILAWDQSVYYYHRLFAYCGLIIATAHAWRAHSDIKFKSSGAACLIFLLGLAVCAAGVFRRRFFQALYFGHLALTIAFVIAASLHGAYLVTIGGILWFFDVVYRSLRSQRLSNITANLLSPRVVCLSFPAERFVYTSGQYIFICLPSISRFEWHPLCIFSCPGEETVLCFAAVCAGWTREILEQILQAKNGLPRGTKDESEDAASGAFKLDAIIDGPYGSLTLDLGSAYYEYILLICENIGLVPLRSICADILQQHRRGRPLTRLRVICSVSDPQLMDMIIVNKWFSFPTFMTDEKPLPRLTGSTLAPAEAYRDWNDANVVRTDFFLTETSVEMGSMSVASQSQVHIGQPDFMALFKEVKDEASSFGLRRVAILTSAPQTVMDNVGIHSFNFSEENFTFNVHRFLLPLQ